MKPPNNLENKTTKKQIDLLCNAQKSLREGFRTIYSFFKAA